MAEEARDAGRGRSRAASACVVARRARALRVAPGRRAVGDAGDPERRRPLHAPSSAPSSPTTRCSASSRTSGSAAASRTSCDLRRGPGGGDPVHRHQRGPDRGLAAHLLDGPVPPAAGAAAPGPPAGSARRTSRSSSSPAIAASTMLPGQDRVPGDDVLVRRDAVVHDRARLGDPVAPATARAASGRGSRRCNFRVSGVEMPLTAVFGGLGTFAAWIVVMALQPRARWLVGAGWMMLGIAVYVVYRRRQGLPLTRDGEGGDARAAGRRGGRVPERARRLRGRARSRRRRWRPRPGWRRGGGGGSTCSRSSPCPTHLPLDAPLRTRRREAQSKIEQAKLIGGLRVTGHVERVRPGQAGRRDRRGGARRSRRPRSSCRCATGTASRCTARRSRPCSPSARPRDRRRPAAASRQRAIA